MCGIAGFFARTTAGGEPPVAAVLAALRHRGPDGEGVYRDDRVTLLHTRLSVVDLSPGGAQPMSAADGAVTIVYNGEIYNFREERRRLEAKGHVFRSNSDTEVILQAYLDEGERFVARLRGMFAFAIYDKREGSGREKLVLARDPFGIKPLLVCDTPRGFAFASELKALLAGRFVTSQIDPIALRDLLACGSVYQPRTMLAGVQMLEPGTIAVHQRGALRSRRYWEFSAARHPELTRASDAEATALVAATLRDSVARQLVADVPICCFLSGGIDSALTTAFMVEQHGAKVCTYSVGFADASNGQDESSDAEIVARHLATEHHAVTIGDRDIVDLVAHIGSSLDQPSIDGANTYFVTRAVARDYKVAVSGTGGDELFAGYPWFDATRGYQPPALSAVAPLARRLFMRRSRWSTLLARLAFTDTAGHFVARHQILGFPGASEAMHADLALQANGWRDSFLDLAHRDRLAHTDVLARLSLLCLHGYTQNQLLRDIDAMSMSNGIEVRVPFLDPVVADVAMALPAHLKIGPVQADATPGSYAAEGIKKVLLDIGRPLLPAGFASRPKRGFNMPFERWLRGPLRELLQDTLNERQVVRDGLLSPSYVSRLLRDFDERCCPASSLWLVLVVSLWHRQVMDA